MHNTTERLGQLSKRGLKNGSFLDLNKSQARIFSLKSVPNSSAEKEETFEEKNMRLKRPQSPHLTIYKPQLTSMLSISHRATGLAMGGLFMSFGIGGLILPKNYPEYLMIVESLHLSPATIIVLKTLVAFPFCYHYCNGVRHLLWDFGKFLTIKEVYRTGYAMLLSALTLTGILVFYL